MSTTEQSANYYYTYFKLYIIEKVGQNYITYSYYTTDKDYNGDSLTNPITVKFYTNTNDTTLLLNIAYDINNNIYLDKNNCNLIYTESYTEKQIFYQNIITKTITNDIYTTEYNIRCDILNDAAMYNNYIIRYFNFSLNGDSPDITDKILSLDFQNPEQTDENIIIQIKLKNYTYSKQILDSYLTQFDRSISGDGSHTYYYSDIHISMKKEHFYILANHLLCNTQLDLQSLKNLLNYLNLIINTLKIYSQNDLVRTYTLLDLNTENQKYFKSFIISYDKLEYILNETEITKVDISELTDAIKKLEPQDISPLTEAITTLSNKLIDFNTTKLSIEDLEDIKKLIKSEDNAGNSTGIIPSLDSIKTAINDNNISTNLQEIKDALPNSVDLNPIKETIKESITEFTTTISSDLQNINKSIKENQQTTNNKIAKLANKAISMHYYVSNPQSNVYDYYPYY